MVNGQKRKMNVLNCLKKTFGCSRGIFVWVLINAQKYSEDESNQDFCLNYSVEFGYER